MIVYLLRERERERERETERVRKEACGNVNRALAVTSFELLCLVLVPTAWGMIRNLHQIPIMMKTVSKTKDDGIPNGGLM